MRLTRSRRASGAWLLPLVGLFAACADPAGPRRGVEAAPVQLTFAIAGTDIQGLSVQVSGPGIQVPIVANVTVPANATSASATIEVPVGGQRSFTARGFDASGIETHEGMTTVAVRGENNPPVVVRMYPKTGSVPVTITPGSYGIAIAPAAPAPVAIGGTVQLTAAIADADGKPVSGSVQWASLNPMAASVDASGLVTALVQGTTTIVATYQGAAASVEVTVSPPPIVFTQVAAGGAFSCGRDANGAAWCWGRNSDGQLGDGTTTDRLHPVAVAGGLAFSKLSLGLNYACGLTTGGVAYCWGGGSNGRLGIGAVPSAQTSPAPVAGGLLFSTLSAGPDHACAVTTAAALFCWGYDEDGAMGVGSPSGIVSVSAPAAVLGAGAASAVAAGSRVNCARTASGAASCWGDADATLGITVTGQLTALFPSTTWQQLVAGTGVYINLTASNGTQYTAFTAIEQFVCGLTIAGAARCWGSNSYGQLGVGNVTSSSTLVTVSGTQNFTSLAAGGGFACGLRADASIACWGRNSDGQVGNGGAAATTPATVTGGYAFTQVAAGVRHACGVRSDGAALCWGNNQWGALGDGTTTSRNVPVLVTP